MGSIIAQLPNLPTHTKCLTWWHYGTCITIVSSTMGLMLQPHICCIHLFKKPILFIMSCTNTVTSLFYLVQIKVCCLHIIHYGVNKNQIDGLSDTIRQLARESYGNFSDISQSFASQLFSPKDLLVPAI